MKALVDLLLLDALMFDPQSVLFLAAVLDLLEVFQGHGQFAKVRSQLAILLSKLTNFFLEEVHMVDRGSVSHGDIQDGLDPMILLVEEVHLVL